MISKLGLIIIFSHNISYYDDLALLFNPIYYFTPAYGVQVTLIFVTLMPTSVPEPLVTVHG